MVTRNHVLSLIIILSTLVHGIFAADKDFLDDDIPTGKHKRPFEGARWLSHHVFEDWKDYVAQDMLKVWAIDDNSTGLFQGDIAGVDPETIRAGDKFVS